MNFANPIDCTNVQTNFEPIPEGWYEVQVVGQKERPTQKGGMQLVIEFSIFGEKYSGRKIWQNYNVVCPGSEKAEEIARTELARLGSSCGIENLRNSEDLNLKVCEVKIVITKDEGFEPKNTIKAYRPTTGSAPVQAAKETAPEVAPWGRLK